MRPYIFLVYVRYKWYQTTIRGKLAQVSLLPGVKIVENAWFWHFSGHELRLLISEDLCHKTTYITFHVLHMRMYTIYITKGMYVVDSEQKWPMWIRYLRRCIKSILFSMCLLISPDVVYGEMVVNAEFPKNFAQNCTGPPFFYYISIICDVFCF